MKADNVSLEQSQSLVDEVVFYLATLQHLATKVNRGFEEGELQN